MYSYKNDNEKSDRTAEGIKNCHKEDYKNVLINKQMHHKMKTIGSNNHQLTSYELNKLSLSWFDDKRYIHLDSITSSTLMDITKYKTEIIKTIMLHQSCGMTLNNFRKHRSFHVSIEPPLL